MLLAHRVAKSDKSLGLQVHLISADTPPSIMFASRLHPLHWLRSYQKRENQSLETNSIIRSKDELVWTGPVRSIEHIMREFFLHLKIKFRTFEIIKSNFQKSRVKKYRILEKSEYEIVETLVRNDQSTASLNNRWWWSIGTRPCPNFETKLWSRKRYSHRCQKTK